MKLPVALIDIRVAIREDLLIVNIISRPKPFCVPICEVIEVGYIPADVSAWLSRLERLPEGFS